MSDTEWQTRALCREVPPDLFYPEIAPEYADSKAICDKCPVVSACLEYALAHMRDEWDVGQHGMWGGTTPPERRRILNRANSRGRWAA